MKEKHGWLTGRCIDEIKQTGAIIVNGYDIQTNYGTYQNEQNMNILNVSDNYTDNMIICMYDNSYHSCVQVKTILV